MHARPLAFSLIALALTGCSNPIANWQGKCFQTGQKLSDQEIINSAIRNYLFRRGGRPKQNLYQLYYNEIKIADRKFLSQFKSSGEFIKNSPGCCSLETIGPDGSEVTFSDEISNYGIYRFVNINYDLPYLDQKSGAKTVVPMSLIFAVNKCGNTSGIDG